MTWTLIVIWLAMSGPQPIIEKHLRLDFFADRQGCIVAGLHVREWYAAVVDFHDENAPWNIAFLCMEHGAAP